MTKLSVEKKIELLKDAEKNFFTESTVKNLAKKIRKDLIAEERYEDCVMVNKLEEKFINRFKNDRENMVRNVGLNKNEMKNLMDLI